MIEDPVDRDAHSFRQREESILTRCRAGDARAWRQLLNQYERLVFSIPLSFGLSRDEAGEVTQATFGELVRRLDSIVMEDRLASWLGTVARRQSFRIMERRRRDADIATASGSQLDIAFDDGASDRVADVEWVVQALDQLPERCRNLLRALYFSDGEPSYEDVAATLAVPVGSIGPTRARCLTALRERLDRLNRSH
jgi:RNA polymerase sigma factor (sigma-70 family)